jgi:hypothetical protein
LRKTYHLLAPVPSPARAKDRSSSTPHTPLRSLNDRLEPPRHVRQHRRGWLRYHHQHQFHWRVPLLQGSRRVHCLPRRGEWSCARLRCATADDGPASPVRRDSACPGLAPGIARSPDCHTHPPGCLRGVSNPHAHHPRNHVEDRLRPWPAKCVCSRQGGMVVHVKRNADSL